MIYSRTFRRSRIAARRDGRSPNGLERRWAFNSALTWDFVEARRQAAGFARLSSVEAR